MLTQTMFVLHDCVEFCSVHNILNQRIKRTQKYRIPYLHCKNSSNGFCIGFATGTDKSYQFHLCMRIAHTRLLQGKTIYIWKLLEGCWIRKVEMKSTKWHWKWGNWKICFAIVEILQLEDTTPINILVFAVQIPLVRRRGVSIKNSIAFTGNASVSCDWNM